MGDTEVLADVTNTDVAMNGDNEVFEDSKVFTQKTSIMLKKSNASSSSARSGSLSGDEDKKGMKRVSRSSRTSSSSYEKKKREPARLAPSAFAKFQQADAMSSSAPAKKINIKLSRSVRDRASETDTTMSTVKQIQDSSDKCKTCGKRVYPVEKLVADKNVYHNTCFKCAECNRTLRVGTYASIDGAIYCKPHFQQLFKLKGNYDEGFGKERAVKKWSAAQGDIPPDGLLKTEAQEPAKKQRRGRDGDADESGGEREEEAPSSDKSEDGESEDEKETSTTPVTKKTGAGKEKVEEKPSSPEHSEDDDDLDDDEDEKQTLTTLSTDKTAAAKEKAEPEGKSSSREHSEDDDSEDEKTITASVTNKTVAANVKAGGKLPSVQQKSSSSDAVPKESRRDNNVSMKTKFFLEKIQDSNVDVPPSTKSTSLPSKVTKESKVSSLKNKPKDSKEALKTAPTKENTDRKISSPPNTASVDKAKDTKVSSSLKSTSSTMDKPKDNKDSSSLKTATKEKADKPLPQENIDTTDKAKDNKVPTTVKTAPAPAKEKAKEKSSSPKNTIPSKDTKDWDSLLSQKTPTKAKDRKFSWSEKIVTPDSGVDVESPSSQKNSRKSSRSKSFSDDDEEEEGRKGSTHKPSEIPQQLLSVKERMAMYRQSAEHPSSEKIKVKSNRYQSEISSTGEARKSTSGDDRKTVATGTLADLRKRWESGDLLTYQEKESTSGTTTGDEMEDTVVKSTSHSHKAIIRQEETIVAQEIKAARSKFESFNDDNDQKPRRMKTSSSDHDMNGVVNNGRSSPYRDEEFGQSNYESGRRSSTGDVEVVKSTTPTADDRELVKAGTASNLKKRWESGDLQDYRERSGSSSSSSSESAHDAEEEPVIIMASRPAEETKSAAPKLQPTQKEVPQPERREMRKSESLKKRYEEKLEKKEAKDEEREEAPRRALNRAPSFSRTMAAKFEKGAVRSRSSSSSSSSQEQDPDAEIVRATSHHHKEKPDKVVNLGLSARLRSMFEKGDVHNVEAPARKSPVAIPRSTSTPDISKAGRRDSTSSSSSEEGEAHAVKTSFSDDEVEHRKADIKGPSAKSLRAMFETNKTEDSGPTTLPKAKPKSISLFKTPPMEKCRACGKTVYAMEKIATDHDTFHKSCFKCDYCKKVLSLGTFAGIHDKLYCKPHFKQLFQAKGNYDEGFGHLQRKSKWAPKSDGPAEDTHERRQIEEAEEVKRPVPTRRPRSADLEDFDDKPPAQDDQDDEEFEVRRPVPAKRQSLPKSVSSSEDEEEEEEKEAVTRRSRSSSSSSDEGPKRRSHSASSGEGSKHRSHSASSGEGRQGRSHSASSEERRTKRRSGSSSSMDEEERRQRELSLKMGSAEEEIKRARLYRQKLLREDSQDEEDC